MPDQQALHLPSQDNGADVEQGSIFFIGTATVILRCAGFTILTDPNFLHQRDHVHLGYGLRSRRRTEPVIGFHELPPLDLVVLSHLHEDHFDRIAERRLDRDLPIITTLQAARGLQAKGFLATQGLDRWDSLLVSKGNASLTITATPGQHGPALASKLLPAVMGSILDFAVGDRTLRVYISGDTVMHDDLQQIPQRYPGVDIALLHLGGTRIAGILLTMDAEQGVQALRLIAPRVAVPIHYDDYTVFKSPLADFASAVRAAGLEDRVHYLDRGETYSFSLASLRPSTHPDAPLTPAPG